MLSQMLHRIALGVPFITRTSFEIEKLLKGAEYARDGRHVFVAGLARGGTTVLLRALYDTGGFRSLTYRDMPFILMPRVWKQLSTSSRRYEDEKERAHGDRIQVSFDSPEAFEEVFWRTFCGNDYIKSDHLRPHKADAETIDRFVEFVAHVLASGGSREALYLSKNNNNILRLTTIQKAFPNATILVPFRNPVQQANSLLNQHRLFCARHKRDRFSLRYMHWLAHHEFGETHKPFRFGLDETSNKSTNDPSSINYWINLWIATYRYVSESMPAGGRLVCYERLCTLPAEVMSEILSSTGIKYSAESNVTVFEQAPEKQVEGVDKEVAAEAYSLYEGMRTQSNEVC